MRPGLTTGVIPASVRIPAIVASQVGPVRRLLRCGAQKTSACPVRADLGSAGQSDSAAVKPAGQTVGMDLLSLHQRLYERTDGRVGHRLIGVPSLLLRTTGRRTGGIRTSALVYARDGGDYVLVPSNGGADRPPGWLFNIEAKPDVEIQVGRTRSAATARVVSAGDAGYPRLWKLVNDRNHGRYDGYQAKTSRKIPLVVVTPS